MTTHCLSIVYTEGYLLTGNPSYRRVVEETLAWVLREMRSSEGAFFSAQDADSAQGEGAYYAWSSESMRQALSSSDALGTRIRVILFYLP